MKIHRPKTESKQLIERVREIVSRGDIEVKRIASDLGVSVTYIHNVIRGFDYRQMLVSPEERRLILRMRAMTKETRSAA